MIVHVLLYNARLALPWPIVRRSIAVFCTLLFKNKMTSVWMNLQGYYPENNDQSLITHQFLQCTDQPKMYPISPGKLPTKAPSSGRGHAIYARIKGGRGCRHPSFWPPAQPFYEGTSTAKTLASRQVSNCRLHRIPRGNARLQKWKTTPAGDSESTGFPRHSAHWDTRFWIWGNKL